NRLRWEVSRNLDHVQEAEFRILRSCDARAKFHERLVFELPEREEDAVPFELDVVFRRRQDVAYLCARGGGSQTPGGAAASDPVIGEPNREPSAAEQRGEHPRRKRCVAPRRVAPQERPAGEVHYVIDHRTGGTLRHAKY